jgi:glutamine cyclotransferase
VNIIDEWEVFAKYAHDKVGFYQILGADKNIEVRVSAGKAGFIKEFENAIDPLLTKILEFCEKERSFLRVGETVRDELFFK